MSAGSRIEIAPRIFDSFGSQYPLSSSVGFEMDISDLPIAIGGEGEEKAWVGFGMDRVLDVARHIDGLTLRPTRDLFR